MVRSQGAASDRFVALSVTTFTNGIWFWSHFVGLLKSDLGVQRLCNKRSCLAAAFSVTEFVTVIAMILVALCVLLKFDLEAALDLDKFMAIVAMN